MIQEQSKEISNREEAHMFHIFSCLSTKTSAKITFYLWRKPEMRRRKVKKQTKAPTIISFFNLLQLPQLKYIR